MAALTLDDFAGAVGARFEMEAGEHRLPVELTSASPLPPSDREGGSFRLEFLGPVDPAFMYGTFVFRRDGRADEIYVTALGRDENGTRYEAVFF